MNADEKPLPHLVGAEVIIRDVFGHPEDEHFPARVRSLKRAASAGQIKSFPYQGEYYFSPADFQTDYHEKALRKRAKKQDRPNLKRLRRVP